MVRKKPKWMRKKKSSHSLVPQWEKYLEKIYFDPSHPGSFKGANKLYQAVKNEGKHVISLPKIKNGYRTKNPSV